MGPPIEITRTGLPTSALRALADAFAGPWSYRSRTGAEPDDLTASMAARQSALL